MASSVSFMTYLNCGHVVLYSPIPTKGDVLWCLLCTDYRLCVRVSKPWRVVCSSCDLTHQYGANEGRVRRTAMRHLRLNPGHLVMIQEGDDPGEIIGSGQDPLPFVTETLPAE